MSRSTAIGGLFQAGAGEAGGLPGRIRSDHGAPP